MGENTKQKHTRCVGFSMLGLLIRSAREVAQLSVKQIAEQTGISTGYLFAIESGVRLPSPAVLMRLATVLNLPNSIWINKYLSTDQGPLRLCELSNVLLSANQIKEADDLAVLALQKSRSLYAGRYNSRIYHLLGKIALAQQDYTKMKDWFMQMFNALHHTPHGYRKGVAIYNYALALSLEGNSGLECLSMLNEAQKIFISNQRTREIGLTEYTKAHVLQMMKQYAAALKTYSGARRYFTNDPATCIEISLGEVICQWAIEPSARFLNALSMLLPDASSFQCARIFHFIGVMYRHENDLVASATYLRKALALYTPTHVRQLAATLAELCLVYVMTNCFDDAQDVFNQFHQIPHSVDAQDIATMVILSTFLHSPPSVIDLSQPINDDYEGRLTAALRIMASNRILP